MTLSKYLNLDQYSIVEFIECGTYGNLYKIIENKSKKLYIADISRFNISKKLGGVNDFFTKEVSIMSSLNHPSFLKFIGFNSKNFKSLDNPTIISEYFASQTLEKLIQNSNSGQLQTKLEDTQKLIIIYGIASGMAFLHKKNITHGNLNSKTILIDDFFHPKIIYSKILQIVGESSKHSDEYDDMSLCFLPETVVDGLNSKEEDVQSFSLILYQILNGRKITKRQNKPYQFNKNVPYVYQKLFEKCNSDICGEVPSFNYIVNLLKNDAEFITEKVDSEVYFKYIESIEDQTQENTKKVFDYDENQNENYDEDYLSENISYENDGFNGYLSENISYENDSFNGYLSENISYENDNDNDYLSERKSVGNVNDNDNDNDYRHESKSNESGDDVLYQTDNKSIAGKKEEDNFDKNTSICCVCQKEIENKADIFYCCGYPYHIKCIKCRICNKSISDLKEVTAEPNTTQNEDSIVCVAPGLFLCRSDFVKYRNKPSDLPEEIKFEYLKKIERKGIDRLLSSNINYDDPLLADLTKGSNKDFNFLSISKDIELFIPSVRFHFTKPLSDINYKEIINEIIHKDMIIINIERGSSFLTIAFISSGKAQETVEKNKEIFEPLVKYFHSATGNSVAGNIGDDPVFIFPTRKSIISFFKRESINLLQLNDILDKLDFSKIKNEVKANLRKKIKETNWEFIFNNQKLYDEAEESIRNSVENNEVELIITGITIIASAKYNAWAELQISNRVELFLYHGSELQNHSSIIKKGFCLQDEIFDSDEERMAYIKEFGEINTDPGYFGIGFYATDNIFYASMYSKPNHKQYLNFNDTGSVICCKTIYNREFCVNLNDHARKKSEFYEKKHIFTGQEMNISIIENYGAHLIYVESSSSFHPSDINPTYGKNSQPKASRNSYVTAFEYVFPRREQMVPVFSVSVMRPRFYVLWFKNIDVFDVYLNQLKRNCEFNIYCKNDLNEAIQFVERKKRNILKLIVSVDNVDLCKEVIDKIRECYQNNFVCLIFSNNLKLLNLAESMENVLFTDNEVYFKKFVKIKLMKKKIINFSRKLKKYYNANGNQKKFNINEDVLLKFHKNNWDFPYNDEYNTMEEDPA